jgi:hypothetical protein
LDSQRSFLSEGEVLWFRRIGSRQSTEGDFYENREPQTSVRLRHFRTSERGAWAPTVAAAGSANLTTLLSDGTGSVTLTFTAVGGEVQIDDVYVDPFEVN